MSGLSAAEVLYGGASQEAARPQHREREHGPSAAEVLYGDSVDAYGDSGYKVVSSAPDESAPAAVQAAREADDARSMYSAQSSHKLALPDGALEDYGLDHAAAREVIEDLGASHDDVTAMVTALNGTDDGTTWRDDARTYLKDNRISAADFAAAQQLVKRDPRVAAWLDETGLGNHPKAVEFFVNAARRARVAGRL